MIALPEGERCCSRPWLEDLTGRFPAMSIWPASISIAATTGVVWPGWRLAVRSGTPLVAVTMSMPMFPPAGAAGCADLHPRALAPSRRRLSPLRQCRAAYEIPGGVAELFADYSDALARTVEIASAAASPSTSCATNIPMS